VVTATEGGMSTTATMKQQQQLQACKIGREWKKANKLSPFDDPLLDQNLIRSENLETVNDISQQQLLHLQLPPDSSSSINNNNSHGMYLSDEEDSRGVAMVDHSSDEDYIGSGSKKNVKKSSKVASSSSCCCCC